MTVRWIVLLGCALCAGAGDASAQEQGVAMLRGTVVDWRTGAPIAGAEVRFLPGGPGSYTARDGTFRVQDVREADTLRVRAIGYFPLRTPRSAVVSGVVSLRLVAAPTSLPDLVAIGGWQPQAAAEMVMPVLRVTRAEVEASGATSVADLLRELPGLQATTAPPTGSGIMIRGIGDGRVLVLRDGVPVPGQQLEDRDLSRLSTLGVETIEVVKGPLSVMHGSQALGGVVNIISRAPKGPLQLEGTAHGGSLGRRDGSVAVQRGGRLAWRATVGWRSQDRLPGQVERDGSVQRVLDGQSTLRTTLGDVALRVDVSALRERQRWAVGGGFFGFNDNTSLTAWSEAAVDRAGGQWTLRVTGQEFRHRFRQALGTIPFEGTGPPTQQERLARVQLTHSRRLAAQHRLDAGVDVSHRRVVAADRLIGEQLSDAMVEGWVQDAMHLGPAIVTAATRVTSNSRWGTAVTPSLGVALEPSGTLRLRAGTARGFRGPSFKELGWNFLNPGAGYLVEGNLGLIPESSWQLFAGATWALHPTLVVEADAYRNNLRDMIDLALVGATETGLQRYAPRNLARARTQGFELATRYSSGSVRLVATYERLDASNSTTGQPLSQRAPHAASLRGTYVLGTPLRLDLGGRWTAAAPVIDAGGTRLADQEALLVGDAAVRFAARDGLVIEAGVENLFDAQPSGWQVALRRTVRAGVRVGVSP
jgi:outer membrane receptor for ferrienterochelin and colicins